MNYTVTYNLNDEQVKLLRDICTLYKHVYGKEVSQETEFNYIMTNKAWGNINSKLKWYYEMLQKSDKTPF